MSRSVSAVAFDLDGTIVDSISTCLVALQQALEATDVGRFSIEELQETAGLPLVRSVPPILAKVGADPDLLGPTIEAYCSEYTSIAHTYTTLFDGITEVIEEMSTRVPLAVVTSQGTDIATAVLDNFELSSYFDVIVGSDRSPTLKPEAGPLLECARLLGTDASSVLVVGDGTVDVLMALAAGASSIGVTWGISTADQLQAAGADVVVETTDGLRVAFNSGPWIFQQMR